MAGNDDPGNATNLINGTTQVTGSTTGATDTFNRYGEGSPPTSLSGSGTAVKGAWFRWKAPSSSSATITTVGSAFDTFLSIYKPKAGQAEPITSDSQLDIVVANDDGGGNSTSSCTFTPISAIVYYVFVSGFSNGATGSYVLNYPSPATIGGSSGPEPGRFLLSA